MKDQNTNINDDSLLIEDQQMPKTHKKHFLLVALCLALLLVLIGGIIFFLNQESTEKTPENTVQQTRQQELDALYASEAMPVAPSGADPYDYGLNDETEVPHSIEGYVVFSGVPLSSDLTTQAYSFDVSTSTFDARVLMPQYVFSGFVEFEDIQNPGDLFFNAASGGENVGTDTDGMRIKRLHVDSEELESFDSAGGTFEQGIAFAPQTHRLAYTRLSTSFGGYVDIVPSQNWEIVVMDPDKDTILKVIDEAFQPKWSPDGTKLVYLKPQGLFMYDFETDTESQVVTTTKGQILATSMIDISPDGKFLIWTVARAGIIVVNEITSWDPLTLVEQGRIHEADTEYYWPQFSPDSEYYIVQAIDSAKPGSMERFNARYQIRSNLNRTVLRTFPLTSFDFNALFTDTWVADLPVIGTSD